MLIGMPAAAGDVRISFFLTNVKPIVMAAHVTEACISIITPEVIIGMWKNLQDFHEIRYPYDFHADRANFI